MNGISPINKSLSPHLSQISKIIADVSELPTTVTDLISQMAYSDFSLACEKPDLREDGSIIESARNQMISWTIELALTSPSTECDPAIKAKIFVNAENSFHFTYSAPPYLVDLIQDIQTKGMRINLDDVTLSCLNTNSFTDLNLSGVSAQRAVIINAEIVGLDLSKADLTGAKIKDSTLINTDLSHATITDAILTNVNFGDTAKVDGLKGNQSGILKNIVELPDTRRIENQTISTTRTFIRETVSASPDTDQFTLPPIRSKTIA